MVAWPAATLGASFPSVPVPEGASGEMVTRHMVYNGVDMRASRFTAPQPISNVKAFYGAEWGSAMVESKLDGKTILGHRSGKHYITVELTPSGGLTRGQVGITRIPDATVATSRGEGFPALSGTLVIEDIVYMDTPQKARTLNMRNRYSPQQNDRYYDRMLRVQGYVREASAAGCTANSRKCVSYFSKGDSRVVVAYVRDASGTQVAAIIE